ncbi:unnamed protein product [Closterium sp. Yama58-4]|nr:unnamed protein product [Closterium sp. Yama58-4]
MLPCSRRFKSQLYHLPIWLQRRRTRRLRRHGTPLRLHRSQPSLQRVPLRRKKFRTKLQEASIEAAVESSDKDLQVECDGVSVCSIVASMISMADSSCNTLLSSSFCNVTRLYSSQDYVDNSKALPWAAVTREAVTAGHSKLKKCNNGDLEREPDQVLKSAATTELASSKRSVSRMALATLKLLPTRIPKPGSARAPALKAVAANERKVLLGSVCSRIPKPGSARAPAVKTVAVEEKKALHGSVCSEDGTGSKQQTRRRQERVDNVKSEGKKGNVRVTRVAAVRPPWRP